MSNKSNLFITFNSTFSIETVNVLNAHCRKQIIYMYGIYKCNQITQIMGTFLGLLKCINFNTNPGLWGLFIYQSFSTVFPLNTCLMVRHKTYSICFSKSPISGRQILNPIYETIKWKYLLSYYADRNLGLGVNTIYCKTESGKYKTMK